MKQLYILSILFLCSNDLLSQKHDYVWVTGHANQFFDSITGYGGSLIDFNYLPVKMNAKQRELNMYLSNASICDSTGKLQFYTNGCAIAGSDDTIIENGEDINPGDFHDQFCINYYDGYGGGPANTIILPWPDSQGVFAMFHKRYQLDFTYSPCDRLFQSTVDMNLNQGAGRVVSKNVPVLSDTLSRAELVAVKHANGLDWWVLTPRRNSNEFYILKLTKAGIVDTFRQTIGVAPNIDNLVLGENQGEMVFSPDGSKLIRTNRYEPIMIYSFDREAGVFTSFDTIHYEYGDQFVGEAGCSVSPNGRFLYLFCRKFLYQFDLLAPDISASQTTIAEWDGFTTPLPTMFWYGQSAPDCKIYIMSGDTRYWHVIHNPDLPGTQCNIEQRGLLLPTRCGSSMPAFPNYRLGPIDNPGAPCTKFTSTASPMPVGEYSVFPNPVSSTLTVTLNRGSSRDLSLHLYDPLGRLATSAPLHLDEADDFARVDVEGLPAGAYTYILRGEGNVVVKMGVLIKI